MEIIFPMRRGGDVGIRSQATEFPPQQWPQTDLANLGSSRPDPAQMTCLIPTI